MVIALTILSVLLTIIVYQDLRYRAVSWLVFPVLLVIGVWVAQHNSGWDTVWKNSLLNLGFIMLQLVGISLYLSAKHKRFINITREYLGWGDILFFVTLTLYFSPLNFIVFYLLSLLLILTGAAFSKIIIRKKAQTIPLAGLQAAVFMLLVGYSFMTSSSLYEETWLQKLIIQ